MIFSIHQPGYFPWLGLLSKIERSDVLIVLDEVQLSDSAYQHRNIFLTNDGKVKYLTIPIEKKDYLRKPFRELRIADLSWGQAHRNFLKNNYRKHPQFDRIFPVIDSVLSMRSEFLVDVVMESMRASMQLMGIDTTVLFQSGIDYDRSVSKGNLVMQLLLASGASEYLSGRGAMAYQDDASFESNNIRLSYADYEARPYPQKGGRAFVPGLSCIDLLFNIRAQDARNYLR